MRLRVAFSVHGGVLRFRIARKTFERNADIIFAGHRS